MKLLNFCQCLESYLLTLLVGIVKFLTISQCLCRLLKHIISADETTYRTARKSMDIQQKLFPPFSDIENSNWLVGRQVCQRLFSFFGVKNQREKVLLIH